MFSIRSKLISLLQPWLQSEPDLELKLGFLRSHGTVKNLQFNVSALNQLIGDSTFFSFEEVKVQDFNIRFSPWSGPALTVELSGLYVNLIAREPVDDGRRSGIDRFEKEKNDILSALDPEGALLHNAIERIFKVTSMKWHMTSLLNVFMRHCRLLIHDIHLELQTCALDETFASFFKMKELRLEALHLAHNCLLKGVIGAIIIPQRVCQVALNANTLEIGLKRDKHIRCLLFLDVILTRIKLKDLRLLDLDVCASQLNISFTPTDLSNLQALNVLAFKEIKHVRNGRELWSIASRRISCLTSNPKLSLHKLVGVVSLWLRYVHSYETLLLMLGYPAEAIIEQSSNRILVDEKFSVPVKNQWNVVSTIEKDLPVEVLARARRIARQRAAVYNPNIGVNIRPHLEVNGNQFLKILSILIRTICDIFQSFAHFLNTHVVLSRQPEVNGTIGVLSENTYQHYCVSFRNILITVYPDIPSVNGVIPESHAYLSRLNLLLFCVTLDAFLLLYTSGNISQSLSLSCGDVKIQASSLMASPTKRSLREETKRSFRKKRNERLTKSKVIVWGEPALKSLHQENIATHSPNSTGSGCSFHLDSCLEELWLNWNKSYKKFEGSNNQYMGNPFLLCEITSSLVDRCPDRPDIGIWKCFMSVGKLNVDLGHSSIISVALLLRQIQHALYSFPGHRRNVVYSQSPSFSEPQEIRWEVLKQLYTSETKLAMLRMAPEKNIQIGVAIAGPKIRVSLQDDLYGRKQDDSNVVTQGQGDLCIVFNLEAIELSVWPTSKASLVASTNGLKTDDVGSECSRLNELQSLDILGEGLHKKFSYQGCIILDSCAGVSDLTVYLEDLDDNHQYQLIGSKSISIRSLLCRDCTLSFTATSIALSASLCGTATESIALLFMDEFEIVLQVVERVLSALSFVFTNLKNINSGDPPEVIRESEASVEMDLDAFTEASEAGMLLVLKQTQSVVNASFKFGSIDVIIHYSRKNHSVERYKTEYKDSHYNFLGGRDVLEQGIAVSVQNSHAQLLWEEGHFKTHICILGFQIIIFHSRSQIGEPRDVYELRNFLYDSPSCLCELTLSNFSLTLCTSTFIAMDNYASGSTMLNSVAGSLAILNGGSDLQSCDFNHGTRSNLLLKPPAQLLINISLDEILMAEYSLKDVLIRADEQKKLLSTFNIGRERHTISWTIQGGLIILETTAFALFVRCFGAYYLWIQNAASILSSGQNVSSRGLPEAVNPYKQMNGSSNHPSQEGLLCSTSSMSHLGTCDTHSQSKLQLLEALTLSLHDFSLVLVTADGSGGVWELILAADLQLNIELMSTGRKIFFDLSRLTILSRHFHGICPENVKDIQNLHLSPVADNKFSSETISGDIPPEFQPRESLPTEDHDSHASVSQDPQEGNIVNDDLAGRSQSKHENYILKHGVASVLVENPVLMHHVGCLWLNSNWVGHCSVSGLDLMISLSEIQMIVSLIEPLSAVSSERVNVKSTQSFSSRDQGQDNIVEDVIPDGAVVAMQDIHQHTYFAVEGIENKFHVCGIVHYSLVEEKALFQVKYCRKKRWQSAGLWFTLISLHAKSSSGEPLLLNYRPGSGFVDISDNNDDCSLWRTLPYGLEPYEADIDLDSNSQAPGNIFYLVNKKSNCSVAFIDGVPEFVKKPGNPFKVKLFPGVPHIHEVLRLNTQLEGSNEQDVQDHTHEGEGRAYGPCINITIDKVQMTIVHELPDSNDKIPLLQACIENIEFIVQILCSKVRIMSTFLVAVYYFDAQGNLWREIVCPVEMCMFYRSRFQSSKTGSKGVPIHYYFRIKQVDVSLTELSLDVLLFVAGELRIAGPFAVRSSAIFANCCKIHNQSSLSLLCHLYDGQNATIAGNHSTSVFIRPVALVNRPESPPNPRFLSVQLMASGDFITSPISVSLLSARVLAWRTRITSLHGSRSSPGPFVVVAVSKTTENGLSVVVSPLLRIHNETGLSMEIRFMRPQHKEAESASVLLRDGDTVDDSMAALDAINLSGGSKKVLTSLTLGNFLFSCKPDITKHSENLVKPVSVDWSQDLKGGKAVRLSGVFDKLNYKFRQALRVDSVKMSFSTVKCSLDVEGAHISDLHFIIQTIGKDVPVIHPDNSKDTSETRNAPVALQEQKEIFLLPTVQIWNHLHSEIHVLLTESNQDLSVTERYKNIGKQATISSGSSAYLYANPAMIYFTVTLTSFNSSCKAVNSADWVKKLQKKKSDTNFLDVNLDFDGGKYFASLRLSRSDKGMLEAAVFTSYVLQNDSDISLLCCASDGKLLSRLEVDEYGSSLPPGVGTYLPPKTTKSWFVKSNRMKLISLEEKGSAAVLDLDIISGFTEICLETHVGPDARYISKLGVSLRPWNKMSVPSQIVLMVPRYVISNETEQPIFVRQHYLEEDIDGIISVDGKHKVALKIKFGSSIRREVNLFDSLFRKHKHSAEDSLIYIQFCIGDIGWSWSGPICVSSLGRFFLKFKRQNISSQVTDPESKLTEFAVVHVLEEGSSLVLRFDRPPNFSPPYRIENLLPNASITYCQKDSADPETLGPKSSVGYVWDDLSLPHQLVVQITGINLSREINMDKVRAWKPIFKVRQQRGLALELPLDKKSRDQIKSKDESHGLETLKVGYEVYADGHTRVLRISEFPGRSKGDAVFQLSGKFQFRISNLAIHLLENKRQEEQLDEPSVYSPVVVARLGNITLKSLFTDPNKYNQITVQSINVDEKWVGAPFAAMLRRNESDFTETNENILQIVIILLSTDSGVRKVKYASTVLQPLQLNLDEETLIKFVPFWRTSLSDPNVKSQQFYFEHFEIHPIKVVASFLPGSSDSSYSSAQETLRSFLHSIVKIPAIKSKNVELNGILLTHALVTVRDLFFKCAQHYSWYGMRAVYIAKGSPLLPPAFASIFDDSASSSLDIFFDPSSGEVNLPGITLGMFKFISRCIDKNGFSGTKRYFGDLGKTVKTAGSNVLFAAVTEISDCVLKGAEANGFNGMMNGFHQGILKLALEPSVLGTAVMEGGPDRKIKLDRSPGVDELYIEGYLQAMLDTIYKQEYLRVRVLDYQVILKNLPPNTSLMNEIMDRVRSFLISKALLKGESSTTSHPLRHLRGESEWRIGPTILTLWEHLFVSFAIRLLRKQTLKFLSDLRGKGNSESDSVKTIVPSPISENKGIKLNIKWGVQKFVLSGIVAYLDGRLCRRIPNAVVRRIVSGFLLSLLDDNNDN